MVRLTPEFFADVPVYRVSEWLEGCRSDGALPGCVWLAGVFLPGIAAEDQAIILFALTETQAQGAHVVIRNGRIERVRELYDVAGQNWAAPERGAIADVLAGRVGPVSSGIQGLALDGLMLVPGN